MTPHDHTRFEENPSYITHNKRLDHICPSFLPPSIISFFHLLTKPIVGIMGHTWAFPAVRFSSVVRCRHVGCMSLRGVFTSPKHICRPPQRSLLLASSLRVHPFGAYGSLGSIRFIATSITDAPPVHELIPIILPAYFNHAMQNGTPSWDTVIARSLTILLYASVSDSREIPEANPSFIRQLSFEDVKLFLAERDGREILTAEIRYRKSGNSRLVQNASFCYQHGPRQ